MKTLREIENEAIKERLALFGGKMRPAALSLGVAYNTLKARVEYLKLPFVRQRRKSDER